jgi:hypothetical protein
MEDTGSSPAEISGVALQLLSTSAERIDAWFAQAEAQFNVVGLLADFFFCDRRSIGQFVLVSGTPLMPTNRF